jgi:NADP-dependent 3-hydroxy acid dehydrogenase YdfG
MSEKKDSTELPKEFSKIIKDFIFDLQTTFPEIKPLMQKWWKDKSTFDYIEEASEREAAFLKSQENSIQFLFNFIQKKMPSRFFDILYQNEEMFQSDSNIDTEFLPHIHFKTLWELDISQKTRNTIWKYLQLIIFSVVGTVHNKDAFGESAKLFDSINQEEFKTKLEKTLSQMQDLFKNMEPGPKEDGQKDNGDESSNGFNIPNAENIQEHISEMLEGKLGKLAKEIAEETAADLNLDMENATDMQDVLQKMMKNPTKLMGLVKNVGDKLDSRMKSGEIKESELMSEAADIMNRMKNMPGMENIQSMLSKMGLGGKNTKVNTGAMEAHLSRQLKTAQMKERMKAKLDLKNKNFNMEQQQQQQQQIPTSNLGPSLTEEELITIFSNGDKPEKTPRNAKPIGKKKKGKK